MARRRRWGGMLLAAKLAVMLLAAKFGVPACSHAGGVGLCEYVQHRSVVDYLRVTCSMEGRVIEYVDHLHAPFVNPVLMQNGRYMAPHAGYSATMKPDSIAAYTYPTGAVSTS